MTIESLTVELPYGSTTTTPDAALANVIVIKVAREGTGFDCILSSPGNREAKHHTGSGEIEFLIAGTAGSPTTDLDPEKVFVKYKY